jgi:hypothetical protein
VLTITCGHVPPSGEPPSPACPGMRSVDFRAKKGAGPWRVRPGDEFSNAVIHAAEGVEAGFPTLTPDRVPVGTKTDYFSWISVTVQFYTRAKINLVNPPPLQDRLWQTHFAIYTITAETSP